MYNKDFGNILAQWRKKAGYESQRQFAMAVGLSSPSVSRIESGIQQVEPETLQKMAPVLKVPYEELMAAAGYLNAQPIGSEDNDGVPDDWMEGLSFIRRAGSTLDENEKQVLLALGREFVKQVEERRRKETVQNSGKKEET